MKKFRIVLSLFCALIFLFSSTFSLAEYASPADVLADGKQVNNHFGLQWLSPMLLDDDTNSALSALLSSVTVETKQSRDENGNSFVQGAVNFGDYNFIDFKVLSQDGACAIELLGCEPFVLPMDEMEGFVENLCSYMISMGIITEEELSEMAEEFTLYYAQLSEEVGKLQENVSNVSLPAEMPASFSEIGAVFSAWAEAALSGEEISDASVSTWNEEAVSRMEYALTAEEIVSLLHNFANAALENETFSTDLLTLLNTSNVSLSFEGEEVLTLEDLNDAYQALLTLSAEDFPSEFTASYAVHTASDASPVFSTLTLHAAEENDLISLNLEFSHLQPAVNFAFSMDDGYDPFNLSFSFVNPPAQIQEDEIGITTTSKSEAYLNMTLDDVSYPFSFIVENILMQGVTVSSRDVSATLGMDLEGSHFEISAIYNNLVSASSDYDASHELTFGFTVDDTIIPIISFNRSVYSSEASECAFTLADAVHPGTMTEGDFSAWMNSIVFTAMERGMTLIAYLPEELTNLMTDGVYIEETETEDQQPASTLPEGAEVVPFSAEETSSAQESETGVQSSEKSNKINAFEGLHD